MTLFEFCSRGISPLVDVAGHDVVDHAVRSLEEHGFCLVRGAFTQSETESMLHGVCEPFEKAVKDVDPDRVGNRGPSRYSFANVLKRNGCWPLTPYTHFLEKTILLDILDAVWKGDYQFISASGDMVLQTLEPQHLHSDFNASRPLDPCLQNWACHSKWAPPCLNIAMFVRDVGHTSGALCIVPWSQIISFADNAIDLDKAQTRGDVQPPFLGEQLVEQPKWFQSRVLASAGDMLIRDPRVWHQGTPNQTEQARHMPSVVVSGGASLSEDDYAAWYPSLPCKIFENLSPRAQEHCARIRVCPMQCSERTRMENHVLEQSSSAGASADPQPSSQDLAEASPGQPSEDADSDADPFAARCANPYCGYLAHPEQHLWPWCCGRCWGLHTGKWLGGPPHGQQCQCRLASDSAETHCKQFSSNADRIVVEFNSELERNNDVQFLLDYGSRFVPELHT